MESNYQIPKCKKRKRYKKKPSFKKFLETNADTFNRMSVQEFQNIHNKVNSTDRPSLWGIMNVMSKEIRDSLKSQGQNTAQRPQVQREENLNQAGPSGVIFNTRKRKPSETITSNSIPKVSAESHSTYRTILGSERPTRFGLRILNRPVEQIYDVNASSVEGSRSRSLSPRTPPLNDTHSDCDSDATSLLTTNRQDFQTDRKNIIEISDNEDDLLLNEPVQDKNTQTITVTDDDDYKNIDGPIYVGIRNATPMSKNKMASVNHALNMAILRIGFNGAGPHFTRCSHKNGWILITCEDHESRQWLEKTIPTLYPWPGAKLSIIPNGELQKPIYTTFLIPWKEGVTARQALELIRIQNQGIETINWKIINGAKIHAGLIILLSIDKHSYEALKHLKGLVNLGAGQIEFKFGANIQEFKQFSPLSPASAQKLSS